MRKKERHKLMVEYIENFYCENHFPPTVRNIQKALAIKSTATVFDDVNYLADTDQIDKIGSNILPKFSEAFLAKFISTAKGERKCF